MAADKSGHPMTGFGDRLTFVADRQSVWQLTSDIQREFITADLLRGTDTLKSKKSGDQIGWGDAANFSQKRTPVWDDPAFFGTGKDGDGGGLRKNAPKHTEPAPEPVLPQDEPEDPATDPLTLPDPEPDPPHEPEQIPDPEPDPDQEPQPVLDPEPAPEPIPDPEPAPNPEPEPAPEPEPEPDPVVLDRYTSGGERDASYNVDVVFDGAWTVELQQAVTDAADFLSSIILGDLPEHKGIDDLELTITLEDIDGSGGVIGSAGPRSIRFPDYMPSTGTVRIDSADAQRFEDRGLLDDVVLHEILHTMGFGTTWSYQSLTTGSVAGDDMVFTGQNANDVYERLYADKAAADGFDFGVPIETDGGSGTAGGHWDEDTFGIELMTGWIGGASYFSELTIAALEDMGYDTIYDDPRNANDLFGPPADDLIFIA